jgi:hypothetical protein
MTIAVSTLDRCETGTNSAHFLRLTPLPCHDPAGGWIKAGGGCQVAVHFNAEVTDRHPGQGTEL